VNGAQGSWRHAGSFLTHRKFMMRHSKWECLWCVYASRAATNPEGAAMKLHSGSSLRGSWPTGQRRAAKLLEGNGKKSGGICHCLDFLSGDGVGSA
jgi:hypothetical protein